MVSLQITVHYKKHEVRAKYLYFQFSRISTFRSELIMSRYRERKGTYKVKEVGDIRPLKSERNKDKEDALNAKIAAIREANKIIERRHREVEADRLEAERNNASVTLVLKKRSKNNSMSSITDSEIAELNIPPERVNQSCVMMMEKCQYSQYIQHTA